MYMYYLLSYKLFGKKSEETIKNLVKSRKEDNDLLSNNAGMEKLLKIKTIKVPLELLNVVFRYKYSVI